MLESFFVRQHPELVDTQWRKKILLSSEILGREPYRQMRPDLLGDRSRLDLMWFRGQLGLRGPSEKGSHDFPFFQIPAAPDTSHARINEMLEPFRNSSVPTFLEMAQLRFRSSPSGEQGLWIDCANLLIKKILEEKAWLSHLVKNLGWKIELGQKRKEAFWRDGELVFAEAEARAWLPSFSHDNRDLSLVCYISSFSQPGPEANRALLACGLELLDQAEGKIQNFCEWGAGYGNLTACFASRYQGKHWSSELESAGVECLKKNHAFFPNALIEQQNAGSGKFPDKDLWILDPPRSGFPELLKLLVTTAHRPPYVLIYHCHNRGLLGDSRLLREAGYQLLEWSSVDVFPATPYHEVISLWKIL